MKPRKAKKADNRGKPSVKFGLDGVRRLRRFGSFLLISHSRLVGWSMDDVALEVERLTKFFGQRAAVRDLSLTARQGDIIGLLSPNGAG